MGANLTPLTNVSPFRKVAMGTWVTARDPSVYAIIEIDATNVLAAMAKYKATHNLEHLTINHVVGRAMAKCFQIRPELNGLIRCNKIYLRDSVKLNYLVNVPGEGNDDDKIKKATLASCNIDNAEKKSIKDIANEMQTLVSNLRKGKDKFMKSSMDTFKLLPWWFAKFYLDLGSFLIYGLNLNLSFLGMPKDPFGSVMITNIGALGIEFAFPPLVPYTRTPFLICIGAIHKKPWIVDGQIVIRPILPLTVTFDHRFADGVHGAQLLAELKKFFNEPEKYLFND